MSFKTWLRERLGYRACQECGNLFERNADIDYGDKLCPTHRREQAAKDRKKKVVMDYVNAHMDEIEPKAIEYANTISRALYGGIGEAFNQQQQAAIERATKAQRNALNMGTMVRL